MKRFATKSLILAAALGAAAAGASAQALTAEIPFPFETNHAVMAPGPYRFDTALGGGGNIMRVVNLDTNRAVLVVPQYRESAEAGPLKVTFTCAGGRCLLNRVGDTVVSNKTPQPAEREARIVALSAVKVK